MNDSNYKIMQKSKTNFFYNAEPTAILPSKITNYLENYFPEAHYQEIKLSENDKGQKYYQINFSDNKLMYHLTFSASGLLTEKKSRPISKSLYPIIANDF